MEGQNQSHKVERIEESSCISPFHTLLGCTTHTHPSLIQRLDPSHSQQDEVRATSTANEGFDA